MIRQRRRSLRQSPADMAAEARRLIDALRRRAWELQADPGEIVVGEPGLGDVEVSTGARGLSASLPNSDKAPVAIRN